MPGIDEQYKIPGKMNEAGSVLHRIEKYKVGNVRQGMYRGKKSSAGGEQI